MFRALCCRLPVRLYVCVSVYVCAYACSFEHGLNGAMARCKYSTVVNSLSLLLALSLSRDRVVLI